MKIHSHEQNHEEYIIQHNTTAAYLISHCHLTMLRYPFIHMNSHTSAPHLPLSLFYLSEKT